MSIKLKFIIYFSIIFVIFSGLSISIIIFTNNIGKYLKTDLPESILALRQDSKLDIIAQIIIYDDEVLTQSARNYAFTGDKAWKDRYNLFIPKLDLRIEQAITSGDNEDKEIFASIDNVNLALIDMETKAIELVDRGQLLSAQEILEGVEYNKQKEIYSEGLNKYLTKREFNFDSAEPISTKIIESANQDLLKRINIIFYSQIVYIFILLLIFIFLGYLIVKTFMVPLYNFKEVAKKITKGDLNEKVDIDQTDEIGDFAKDFNQMVLSLKQAIENVEDKVRDRTAELEKFNNLMVGRELKMSELKKEILNLESQINNNSKKIL